MKTVFERRRRELGISQAEMADIAGVSAGLISKVENLNSPLKLNVWRRIATTLKLSSKKLSIEIDGEYWARERLHDED